MRLGSIALILMVCASTFAQGADEELETFVQKLEQDIAKLQTELTRQGREIEALAGKAGRGELLYAQAENLVRLADLQSMLAAEKKVVKFFEAPDVVRSREKAIAVAERILAEHAKKFYERLETHPGSPLLSYARYKRAWIAVNQMDFQRGAELFVEVAQAPIPKGEAGKAQRNLRINALKDLVFCITEVVQSEKTLDYMKKLKLSREEELWVLPGLARRLWTKEQARAALAVYDHLIPLAVDDQDREDWMEQARQIQEYLKTQR